jgi:endonuclease/exonuclease/phosphatase family metal-dependent hydrolase
MVGTLAALGLVLTSCGSDPEEPTIRSAPEPDLLSLNIMQFNIEYGGDGVDFSSVAKAIEAADADVVAIQEGYAKMPQIAEDLGWEYYDARTQTVSKYPLLTPSADVAGLNYVDVGDGVIAVFNLHLTSTGYGPNKVLAGESKADILARENRGRLSELQPALEEAESLMTQGVPTFVLGDFNAPSHLDWTEETVGTRTQVEYPLDWPTSIAAEQAGLEDVYRAVYPDPVANPGLTWPASRPFVQGYNPGPAGKPADRIDQMYVGGDAEPTAVSIVGEPNADDTDIAVNPWPSDHRAVVAHVDVVPGLPWSTVSTDRRLVEQGEETNVRYVTGSGRAGALAIVPTGGALSTAVQQQQVVNPWRGAWAVASGELSAGGYDALLLDTNDREISRSPFWVVAPGTKAEISTTSDEYREGDPIEVSWDSAPGNKWDWIGIYKQGANPNIAYYKLWAYTDATVAGSLTVDGETASGRWPLPAGDYSVYLLADDSYAKLAGSDFQVR